jgi:hypothetical protein
VTAVPCAALIDDQVRGVAVAAAGLRADSPPPAARDEASVAAAVFDVAVPEPGASTRPSPVVRNSLTA